MIELECQHPKDKKIWFESIREAIEQCPEEFEIDAHATGTAERLRHMLSKI